MKCLIRSLMLVMIFIPMPSLAKDLVVKEPPKSMDKLYPPASKDLKWVHLMHKISGQFGGVFVSVGNKDWVNAEKHAAQFVEAYKEASDLIPEWKDYFDHEAVKAFAAEVKTHDPEKIGKASGAVGKTCGKCHNEQYISVWTKYHWPSVEKIKLTDPIDDKELGYGKYMGALAKSLRGVTVNFQDEHYDLAKKALGGFKKRYTELKSVCSKCHTEDAVKQFYVGETVSKAFSNLEAELNSPKPNPAIFWKNIEVVDTEGCKKCHLTHRSYVIIQDMWEAK